MPRVTTSQLLERVETLESQVEQLMKRLDKAGRVVKAQQEEIGRTAQYTRLAFAKIKGLRLQSPITTKQA